MKKNRHLQKMHASRGKFLHILSAADSVSECTTLVHLNYPSFESVHITLKGKTS